MVARFILLGSLGVMGCASTEPVAGASPIDNSGDAATDSAATDAPAIDALDAPPSDSHEAEAPDASDSATGVDGSTCEPDAAVCSDDPLAECSACETTSVGCGYCGVRAVSCDTSEQACQWVLGVCESSGACSPGAFELDSTGCLPETARTRWCTAACQWDVEQPCSQPPGWDGLPAFLLAQRSGFASVAMGSSRLFVFGGASTSGAFFDDGATFDLTSGWTALPEASAPGDDGGTWELAPRAHASVVWTGQRVLVWGGQGQGGVLSDGARFSLTDGWQPMSSGIGARAAAPAVWSAEHGVMLVWGGRATSGSALGTGGRYDPVFDTWTAMSPAPMGPRMEHSIVWDADGGRVIVWGGRGGAMDPAERSGAIYYPATDSWALIAPAPVRRAGHVAFWVPSTRRMLVLFGMDDRWTVPRSDGAAYDPETNTWELIQDLSVTGYPLSHGYRAAFGDEQVWVTGGDGAMMGEPTALGARLDPRYYAWSLLPPMQQARTSHGAAFVGRLMVFGGGITEALREMAH